MQNETPDQPQDNEMNNVTQINNEQENLKPATGDVDSTSIPEEANAQKITPPAVGPQKTEPGNGGEQIKKKESGFKRFLRFMFGADTSMGRFMRPFLRYLAIIVIVLTSGLLIGYLTLYIPARSHYDQAVVEIQQLNTQLNDAQSSITVLEGEKLTMQSTMAVQQSEIELSNYKLYFLLAKNDVLRAKLALLDEENGPGGPTALAALDDLENHLNELLPYVQSEDPVLADLLTSRLAVVQNEMIRDTEQAKVELETFYTNLQELEATLFEQ